MASPSPKPLRIPDDPAHIASTSRVAGLLGLELLSLLPFPPLLLYLHVPLLVLPCLPAFYLLQLSPHSRLLLLRFPFQDLWCLDSFAFIFELSPAFSCSSSSAALAACELSPCLAAFACPSNLLKPPSSSSSSSSGSSQRSIVALSPASASCPCLDFWRGCQAQYGTQMQARTQTAQRFEWTRSCVEVYIVAVVLDSQSAPLKQPSMSLPVNVDDELRTCLLLLHSRVREDASQAGEKQEEGETKQSSVTNSNIEDLLESLEVEGSQQATSQQGEQTR